MAATQPARLNGNRLTLGPVIVTFQRTLRIPEDGIHPLPPGLGVFPLRRVEDYPNTVPAHWRARGGIMLPVYQREAMWLNFHAEEPSALQIGIGKVCAVSGEAWTERLTSEPQNYVCLPEQPWLDGINAGDGFIRQFVAVPLGKGATVEAHITGQELHGGLQLRAVGLTAAALARLRSRHMDEAITPLYTSAPDMGLGAGGRMRQQIFPDSRPLNSYDPGRSWRVFVHLCSAEQWTAITGEAPPPSPVDRDAYVEAGLPWFDYFDADAGDVPAPHSLTTTPTVGAILGNTDGQPTPLDPTTIITLPTPHSSTVTNGDW